jgi:hypothetical protein
MGSLASSGARADYVLALAQGLSGLLAIAVAVLAFLGERTVRRRRARDSAYQRNLGLMVFAAAATLLLALLCWSTWSAAAPAGVKLLLGLDSRVWLAVVFGLASAGALACLAGAGVLLARYRRDARGAESWEP